MDDEFIAREISGDLPDRSLLTDEQSNLVDILVRCAIEDGGILCLFMPLYDDVRDHVILALCNHGLEWHMTDYPHLTAPDWLQSEDPLVCL